MLKRRGYATRRVLGTTLLAVTLVAGTPSPSYSNGSNSVVLTTAEADSIILTIDELTLEVGLLQADLYEVTAGARADSALAADKLALARETYETILTAYKDDRDSWLKRLLKQPVLWLALGAWIGVQAR